MLKPPRESMLIVGGSRPLLAAEVAGKVITGAARMGTPRKCSTAPWARPSFWSKSRSSWSMRSTQSGSLPSSGLQLL
jgi:hypothetical protein